MPFDENTRKGRAEHQRVQGPTIGQRAKRSYTRLIFSFRKRLECLALINEKRPQKLTRQRVCSAKLFT